MSRLGLFLLGPPEIQIQDRPVSFQTRKSTALLAYLSVTGKPCPRDTLATFLWPELSQSRARASLRHALWTIGSAGLADWLEIQHELVRLKPGYTLDIVAFHEKLAQVREHSHAVGAACSTCTGDLTEAAGLYRGDFLAGFTLRDSSEFDEWQLLQAESLRQELAEALERLVGMHSAAGAWDQALPQARRWVSLDALNEPAHRSLMKIYVQGGKRGLALKQYETLRHTLDRELGIEPDVETRQLFQEILSGRFLVEIVQPAPLPEQPAKTSLLHNIPTPFTPLLGRELEVAALREYILRPDTHLLTLTGPPGIGKTRLSIQVASELAEHFKDGVSFIPLAPISDPNLVPITITQALSIIESGDWTPITALKNYFHQKKSLLVLDNFEQVLEAAPLVIDLIQSCPGLKILVTSRAPLKISGERQYPLAPLPLPDLERLPSLEILSSYPALALFVARASLVDPEFSLTESNAAIIAEICHHLDGLPLAIELAAAWVKFLPPQKLLARLSNRLALLRGGPVDLPARQRTLRAAIDWSYELLGAWEQALLARLTIFVGGWTLEAAGAIAGGSGSQGERASSDDVLEGLFNLVDKSLVKREAHPEGQGRFSMLETICEYASEKLASSEIESLQQRYASYYLELAEASDPALRGSQQQQWLVLLNEEHNNLRAALQWVLDRQDAEMALKLAGSLWRYWWMHGHLSEGRDWLEKALAIPSAAIPSTQQGAWRAKALNGVGVLARSQGDYASARVFLEECLQIRRGLEDRDGLTAVLNSLGVLAQYQGDFDVAYDYHTESLRYRREIGGKREIAISLNNLAMVAQEQGAFAQADELYRESLLLHKQADDARGIAAVLANWGTLMNDQGNARKADDLFRESFSILKDLGQRDDIIECLEGIAGVAILLQQPQRAARLFGAAQALREMIGAPAPPYKIPRHQRFLESVEAQLDRKTVEYELMIGKKMSLNEAMEYALNEGTG